LKLTLYAWERVVARGMKEATLPKSENLRKEKKTDKGRGSSRVVRKSLTDTRERVSHGDRAGHGTRRIRKIRKVCQE